MTNAPANETGSKKSAISWTFYAFASCTFAAVVAPYLLAFWFDFLAVRFTLLVVALAFFILYVFIDGFTPLKSAKRNKHKESESK